MKLKHDFWVGWAIAAIVLRSCSNQTTSPRQQPDLKREISLRAVPLDKTKVVMGRTVYVPIYSHIYHYNSQDRVMNLSATLSSRNTDLTNSIIITSVRYYNTTILMGN